MHVGMDRADRFTVSGKLYAVDLASFTLNERRRGSMDAVWYRRKNGVTYANTGRLWGYGDATTAEGFLDEIGTRVYGPMTHARYGPDGLWTPGAVSPAEMDGYVCLLSPMLTDIPSVPAGFDGWWKFR